MHVCVDAKNTHACVWGIMSCRLDELCMCGGHTHTHSQACLALPCLAWLAGWLATVARQCNWGTGVDHSQAKKKKKRKKVAVCEHVTAARAEISKKAVVGVCPNPAHTLLLGLALDLPGLRAAAAGSSAAVLCCGLRLPAPLRRWRRRLSSVIVLIDDKCGSTHARSEARGQTGRERGGLKPCATMGVCHARAGPGRVHSLLVFLLLLVFVLGVCCSFCCRRRRRRLDWTTKNEQPAVFFFFLFGWATLL